MTKKGIDVSHWQGDIDWNAVKAAGYDFAILAAGYGRVLSQKDKKFEQNYAGAKAAGLKVGCYWYSYAMSAQEAETEANVFLQAIQGKTFDYPVFYDVEESSQLNYSGGTRIANLIIPAFLEKVKAAGYYVGLYTFLSFSNNVNKALLDKYDVWIAEIDTPSTHYTGKHTMWQYTWKLKVPGIAGEVDGDYCYVDYPAIINGTKEESVVEEKKEDVVEEDHTIHASVDTKITLENTPIYSSSTAKKSNGTKTGTFYRYDDKIVNGRIRITNSEANIGKTPIGSYVTGWIQVTDDSVSGTIKASTDDEGNFIPIAAGREIKLEGAKLYTSATAKKVAATKTGTFYIYDDRIDHNRIRITDSAANVGKTPIGKYVTGWVDRLDIK